jgi:hypothetical protein
VKSQRSTKEPPASVERFRPARSRWENEGTAKWGLCDGRTHGCQALVVIDLTSQNCLLFAIKRKFSPPDVVRELAKISMPYGRPTGLIVDHSKLMHSPEMLEWSRREGVDLMYANGPSVKAAGERAFVKLTSALIRLAPVAGPYHLRKMAGELRKIYNAQIRVSDAMGSKNL